jgi:ABC-2 type transport system permease protein
MSWSTMRVLVRRDLLAVVRNPGVRVPLLVAPTVILVFLPALLVLGGSGLASSSPVPIDADTAFEALRGQTQAGNVPLAGGGSVAVNATARWTLFVLEFLLAPLFLLIPLIVATVIAADSFAGERERRTLEPLLQTPTTDTELLFAKILAAWLPAFTVSTVGFLVYGVLANLLAWTHVEAIFFPTPMWLALAFWVSPPLALCGLGLMVLVSSRVNSLDLGLVLGMGLALWIAAALLLVIAAQVFTRDHLAARL